jgi:hypothetical protein
MSKPFVAAAIVATCLAVGGAPAVLAAPPPSSQAAALVDRYRQLEPVLANSPFRRPVAVQSRPSDEAPNGEVYAVIDHPFGAAGQALRRADSWCAVMLLQTNVKRCTARGQGADQQLEVGITRRYTDSPDQAVAVRFRFGVQSAGPDHLAVRLSADEGPVGTSRYQLRFEAAPLDARRSFVHLSYAYEAGFAARMATNAYLSTSGADKVGFSTTGRTADGKPKFVGGIQGVAERNTMRYFLAIDAFLDTLAAGHERRLDQRLRRYHALLEQYPAQLHETELAEYLQMKRREAGAGS